MNHLIATVSTIQNCDNLHHITFDCYGYSIAMMSLELPQDIIIGTKVKLLIKATHVVLAKAFTGRISYANHLPMTVHTVNNGRILSSILLEFNETRIESIMLRTSSEDMSLKVGDKVTTLIQASEVAIGEVLYD